MVAEPSGFDDWNVLRGQGRYFDPVMNRIDGTCTGGFSADVITDLTQQWLEEKRDLNCPFCMMVHDKIRRR